jgi:hypothetical protein
MRTRSTGDERAEFLASWCEIDLEPVWQWGFIERVSTRLANVREFVGEHHCQPTQRVISGMRFPVCRFSFPI